MAPRFRVVIIGAGVLGAATANALARRGETDVLVVDRMGPASGATGRGAGVVSHLTWDPLNVRLITHSARRYRGLSEAEGAAPFTFHETGGLTLVGEDAAGHARRLARLQRDAGADAAYLDADELARHPAAQALDLDGVAGALHCPRDGWTVGTDATRRLLGDAHLRGVAVRWFDPVARVEQGPRGPRVALRGGRHVEAEAVVVAAGAWSPKLLADSGLPTPARGYRTQAAVVAWAPPADFPVLHDTLGHYYARPEGPGKLLVGDGTDTNPHPPAGYKESPDPAFLEHVAAGLTRRVPAAATAEVTNGWAGVDTATPDRHPILGADPRAEGVHHAYGGNGFGFMRAPALGDCLAAQLLGEAPPHDVAAFAPARFEGRWKEDFHAREGFTL